MSDLVLFTIAAIIVVCIAYGWAYQIGYKRGFYDGRREHIKRMLNEKYGLNPLDAVLDYEEEDE